VAQRIQPNLVVVLLRLALPRGRTLLYSSISIYLPIFIYLSIDILFAHRVAQRIQPNLVVVLLRLALPHGRALLLGVARFVKIGLDHHDDRLDRNKHLRRIETIYVCI